MKRGKERDILEFYPTALYTVAMIAKSGGSLEEGLHFVATHDFGRVSLLFRQVLDIAHEDSLIKGLESLRERSDNRYFRESVIVMIQYAKYTEPIADRLVALGHRMETDAVMAKRNHYRRVREALIPQTTMLLAGMGFLFVVIYLVLTRDWPMQEGGPIIRKKDMVPMIIGWLIVMAIVYPVLYREYIFRNPAFVMPTLKELKQLFGNQNDMAVSRFLTSTASYITMGWTLEMAAANALPEQQTSTLPGDALWATRAMDMMSDGSRTFDSTLLSLGLLANSRKYDLTVLFLKEARESRYASLAETLRYLADTFWSSHLTVQYYQADLLTPTVGSFALKFPFIFLLAFIFPALAPFLILALIIDTILLLFCMA